MPGHKFKEGRKKTGGRVAGTPNRFPSTVKEVFLQTFLELQNDPENNLPAFARKYPRDFYPIAAKLIPTEVRQEISIPEGIKLQFITDPGCKPITDDNQTDPGNPDILGEQSGL